MKTEEELNKIARAVGKDHPMNAEEVNADQTGSNQGAANPANPWPAMVENTLRTLGPAQVVDDPSPWVAKKVVRPDAEVEQEYGLPPGSLNSAAAQDLKKLYEAIHGANHFRPQKATPSAAKTPEEYQEFVENMAKGLAKLPITPEQKKTLIKQVLALKKEKDTLIKEAEAKSKKMFEEMVARVEKEAFSDTKRTPAEQKAVLDFLSKSPGKGFDQAVKAAGDLMTSIEEHAEKAVDAELVAANANAIECTKAEIADLEAKNAATRAETAKIQRQTEALRIMNEAATTFGPIPAHTDHQKSEEWNRKNPALPPLVFADGTPLPTVENPWLKAQRLEKDLAFCHQQLLNYEKEATVKTDLLSRLQHRVQQDAIAFEAMSKELADANALATSEQEARFKAVDLLTLKDAAYQDVCQRREKERETRLEEGKNMLEAVENAEKTVDAYKNERDRYSIEVINVQNQLESANLTATVLLIALTLAFLGNIVLFCIHFLAN